MKKLLGLAIATLVLLAIAGASPACAERVAPVSAPAVAVAPAPPGCDSGLDLSALSKGEICSAAAPVEGATAEFMASPKIRRTCRCSCGFPCQTNADCGPGGVCSPGITCC